MEEEAKAVEGEGAKAAHQAAVLQMVARHQEAHRQAEKVLVHHLHQQAAVQQPAQASLLHTGEATTVAVPLSPTLQAIAPRQESLQSSSSPQAHSLSSLRSGSTVSTATRTHIPIASTTRPRT